MNDELKAALDRIALACGFGAYLPEDLASHVERSLAELVLLRASIRRVSATLINNEQLVVVMDDEQDIQCVRIASVREAIAENTNAGDASAEEVCS